MIGVWWRELDDEEQKSNSESKAVLKVRGSKLFLATVALINEITKDYKELLLKT